MALECFCIRGIYRFYIKSIDNTVLIYKDSSDWMDEVDANYITPTEYVINVTPPGTGQSTAFTVLVNHNNRLTWGDTKLKDGVYCFSTKSCGKEYIRTVGIFPQIECCLKQAWANLGIEFKSRLEEVRSYLDMASINAELNNVKTAAKNLKIAEKLLENLKCDCSC